jgi:hypothetical protein
MTRYSLERTDMPIVAQQSLFPASPPARRKTRASQGYRAQNLEAALIILQGPCEPSLATYWACTVIGAERVGADAADYRASDGRQR